MALANFAIGDRGSAERWFRKARDVEVESISSTPLKIVSQFNLAIYLRAFDEIDAAVAQFRDALESCAHNIPVKPVAKDLEEFHQVTGKEIADLTLLLHEYANPPQA